MMRRDAVVQYFMQQQARRNLEFGPTNIWNNQYLAQNLSFYCSLEVKAMTMFDTKVWCLYFIVKLNFVLTNFKTFRRACTNNSTSYVARREN